MINKNISALILMLSFNNFVNCVNGGIQKMPCAANPEDRILITKKIRKLESLSRMPNLPPRNNLIQKINKYSRFYINLQGKTSKEERIKTLIIIVKAKAENIYPGFIASCINFPN